MMMIYKSWKIVKDILGRLANLSFVLPQLGQPVNPSHNTYAHALHSLVLAGQRTVCPVAITQWTRSTARPIAVLHSRRTPPQSPVVVGCG